MIENIFLTLKLMNIRNAIKEDVPDILDILNEAIANTTAVYDYQPRTLEMQIDWFAKKQEANMPVLVVMEGGKVIGFGSYSVFRPWEGYKYSAEHSIYIDSKHRGKGLGKRMLIELIQLAKDNGMHCMIAGIDSENTVSIELHKKVGFKEVGQFKEVGYKFNRWLDAVFMQLVF